MSNLSSHDPLRADKQEQTIKTLQERNAELQETLLQTQRELGNMRGFRDRALSELAECQPIIEAARKIHHWHDTDNGGMVVSEEAVHTLWDALLSYDDGKETARPAPEVIARAAIPENGATEAK